MTHITLEWENDSGRRHEQVTSLQTVTLGRHPACDIVLGDAHVSRRHASISFSDDTFHLQNHSQTNPIVFNDRWQLTNGITADLKPGDTFTIGRVRMKVGLLAFSGNGHGKNGHGPGQHCPSCGHVLKDNRATCPLCGITIRPH